MLTARGTVVITDITDGANSRPLALYIKSTSTTPPTSFTGTATYTFSTDSLTGLTLNSWSRTAPSISNGEYLWVRQAVASSITNTATINIGAWSTAAIVGVGGANGANSAVISLYKKAPIEYYNLASATLAKSFSVASQEANPTGMFISPDGIDLYVIGFTSDQVRHYKLGSAWDVSTSTLVASFSVATWETSPRGIFFSPSGVNMYVVGANSDAVQEFSLSTPWVITTATRVRSFSVSVTDVVPQDIFFSPDGTKMFVVVSTTRTVIQYSLSTAWNVSTATVDFTFSVVAQETVPTSIFFKPDGSRLYVAGSTGDDVNEYSLSTPWQLSTAVFVREVLIPTFDTAVQAIFFNPDGSKFFHVGTTDDTIYQHDLFLSPPESFTGTATYTFSTQGLTGLTLNGWSSTPPQVATSNELVWVRQVSVSADTPSVSILLSQWSTAVTTAAVPAPGPRGAGWWRYDAGSLDLTPVDTTSEVNVFWDALHNPDIAPVKDDRFIIATSHPSGTKAFIYNGVDWVTQAAFVDGNLLVAGTITGNKIAANTITAGNLNVSQLSALTAQIGLLRTASTGQRVEIEDNRIRVFDSNNVVRVIIGDLS
jgi:6-phosphogluconolactonase (cycloisomerase 2 family)